MRRYLSLLHEMCVHASLHNMVRRCSRVAVEVVRTGILVTVGFLYAIASS